jgi:hypothetical protein
MQVSRAIFVTAWSLLLPGVAARAQGTFTVTFNGPPVQPPGTQSGVQSYYESGVWFLPFPGSEFGFVRNGGGILGYPDNGTAYLQAGFASTLIFGMEDGSSFDPVSVDLAEYSDVLRDPVTVHFVGYRRDGTVLTDDIRTAGVFNGSAPVFQTFTFDPAFSDLVRVEIPYPPWSLDNLVVSVPEPGASILAMWGAALFGLAKWKKGR